ncbi:hypothetical protein J7643_05645 [bacterium]|nr:hypothetical protein [bacterium]
MKKTLGMIALTGGLVAAGCAMLPTTGAKAPAGQPTAVGLSGPGSAEFSVGGAARGIQALPGGANGAKYVVARIYAADPTNGTTYAASKSIAIESVDGNPLVATASVPSTGIVSLTLPKIPAGKHVIQVSAYNTVTPDMTAAFVENPGAKNELVAQSEAFVQTAVGLPYNVTFPVYTILRAASTSLTIEASPSANATTSAGIKLTTAAPATGLYLRMANWNPYANLSASESVRLVITHPSTGFTQAFVSAPGTASWTIGDIRSTNGFSAATNISTWSYSPDRKYLYTDINFKTFNASYASLYATDSYAVKDQGSFSLFLPAAFVPTNAEIVLHDLGLGGSQSGTGGL